MRHTPRAAALRDALHAEWTKVRTAPDTIWLLLAVLVLTVAASGAAAAIACTADGCVADPTKVSLTGIELGQAAVAVLAVLAMGNEYSTRMINITLTAIPRRTTALAGKAIILTGLVTGVATIGVLGCMLAGRMILPDPGPGAGPVLRAVTGSVLYLVLIALLSLGTAAAVRDSATAIGTVLGLLYVFPIITQMVSEPHVRRHLEQIAPMSAGLAIQATTRLDRLPISPWAGLGVLAAWAGTALITGWLLLQLRDA